MAVTPMGRVSFPDVFRPKAMQSQDGSAQEPKYRITLIFRPSEMNEADRKLFDELVDSANDVCLEKFKVPINGEYKGQPLKNPFRRGETKPDYYQPGDVFVAFSSKTAPNVVDQKKSPITEQSGAFYAGCYARVSYSKPYAFDHTGNRGVTFSCLNNVQKMADGEPFGAGRTDPDEDFDEVAGGAVNDVAF